MSQAVIRDFIQAKLQCPYLRTHRVDAKQKRPAGIFQTGRFELSETTVRIRAGVTRQRDPLVGGFRQGRRA